LPATSGPEGPSFAEPVSDAAASGVVGRAPRPGPATFRRTLDRTPAPLGGST